MRNYLNILADSLTFTIYTVKRQEFQQRPNRTTIMIELKPDENRERKENPRQNPESGGFETVNSPAIDDLRFFVKGSLSLFSKFINDLDWFLSTINTRNKT